MRGNTRFDSVAEGSFLLSFMEPGEYGYSVQQEQGRNGISGYDETVYRVVAYVWYNDDGALVCSVVASIDGSSRKPDVLVFDNAVTESHEPEDNGPGVDSSVPEPPTEDSGPSGAANPQTGIDGGAFVLATMSVSGLVFLAAVFAARGLLGGRRDRGPR